MTHPPGAELAPTRLDIDLTAGLRRLGVDPAYPAAVVQHLRRIVPSALGMSIYLRSYQGPDVALDVHLLTQILRPDDIGAAIQLADRQLVPGTDAAVTFYASQPGAFTAIHRALLETCRLPPDSVDQDPPLPTVPLLPGVFGLEAAAAVQQALGLLINRGHNVAEAHAELCNRAQLADIDLVTTARRLLTPAK